MRILRCAIIAAPLWAMSIDAGTAAGRDDHDPLRFFEGKTESVSTVKVLFRKSYETRAIGTGRIENGRLELVQRVERDGHPTEIRRWSIRQVGPGHYAGTMSDAVGPVDIKQVDGRYRFRFRMDGHLSVEQWLTPQPGWRAAENNLTIRRLGIKVGSSDGVIRKLS
jgi:hypothetical protein